MTELQELREIVQQQARRVTVLTRLVERMGGDMTEPLEQFYDYAPMDYSYTIIGQRQLDAEAHEAEGAPPDAGMLEAVQ